MDVIRGSIIEEVIVLLEGSRTCNKRKAIVVLDSNNLVAVWKNSRNCRQLRRGEGENERMKEEVPAQSMPQSKRDG